jgi:hypothetical protein
LNHKKYLDKNSQLFEFEWYLRDLLFRSNDNTSAEFCKMFETREIVSILHEKYLRYRTWKVDQIGSTLSHVLPILQKSGAIVYEPAIGIIQLISKLDRKQCSLCFYINCLGSEEPKLCLRCGSDELVEFPKPKKL